jgi:rSAM/selenodomain-associated transferase 1
MKDALVIMAKAPIAGKVKTRLIGALDADAAANLYAAFLGDTFALAEEIRDELEAEAEAEELDYLLSVVLCYTPPEQEEAFEGIEREGSLMIPQRGRDLGERLQNCFADLFDAGYENVVIIGGDSPTLPGEYLLDAFDALDHENAVVIGPTRDGGYYLIGLRRFHRQLFDGISWSTDQVLTQTQQRASQLHLAVRLLPEWYDVDTPAELERLKRELRENSQMAVHTQKFLRSVF